MIDFHTHILPQIDDGASSVDESLEMLKIQLEQGVNTVVATPHFTFENSDVDEFLNARNTSFLNLMNEAESNKIKIPKILLGSEVKITPHLSKRKGIEKLCIGNTKLILLEMPYRSWKEKWVADEIFSVIVTNKLIPVIAHIDRYISRRKDFKHLSRLSRMDIYFQINIDSYKERHSRKVIDKLIKEGRADIVGSDCHNISNRLPKFVDRLSLIEKKHGNDIISTFKQNASMLLNIQK